MTGSKTKRILLFTIGGGLLGFVASFAYISFGLT
jgi:hypothetical protein